MSKRGYKQLPNSVQNRQISDSPTLAPYGLWSFQMATSFATEIPPYWSPARDIWLRNFYKKPGNDLLAGTISTVISKVETTGWYVEGPERMANMFQRILMRESEFGAGWSIFCQKAVLPYLTQDNGMWIERRRATTIDREGAALGFANFDSAQITPSADPTNPAWFLDDEGNYHKLHFSQVGHIVDMPSDDHRMNNVGFCALSRAAMTARILMMIAKYKYERLSDLPPAGLLILNNLTEGQWKDMQDKYTAGEMNKNNSTWRNIMVAFGLDPSLKAEASLFEFSRLPEHFDEAKATEIAVYSFALAFNIDPGDVWPRSNTPLGTASEANISHLKAKGKRVGSIYADFERFFNDGFSLPKTCLFAFDYKDTDEDAQAAEIANLRAQLIRKLWEPPANAKLGFGAAPVEEAAPEIPSSDNTQGIITRDEARAMAVLSGIAPDWLLKTNATQMSISDTGIEKSGIDMGPKSRVYRNGMVLRLECRPQIWSGFTHKTLTTDAVVRALKGEENKREPELKFQPALNVTVNTPPMTFTMPPMTPTIVNNIESPELKTEPIINVNVPESKSPALPNIEINVEPTPVTVENTFAPNIPEQPAPDINVAGPTINVAPTPVTLTMAKSVSIIKRDYLGQIIEIDSDTEVNNG